MSLKIYFSQCIRALLGKPGIHVTADIHTIEPSQLLRGKSIVITGGGRGLGAAMAKKFVEQGANVLIAGRNEVTLKTTSQSIGCFYELLDVTNTGSFNAFIAKAADKLGELDYLVNNAGISLHERTFLDVTPDGFNQQLATNLLGPFFLTQCFISRSLSLNKKAGVLFISSETGETSDIRPYGLTKAAINSLVKGLANMYAKTGIRVNAIAPGVTASDMTGFSVNGNLYCSYNINNRVYLPEEVAELACFLLSDAAGCISGQIVTCNNAKTVNPRWGK